MFYYWSINTNVVSLVLRPEMFETAIKESTSSSKSPPSKHFAKKTMLLLLTLQHWFKKLFKEQLFR